MVRADERLALNRDGSEHGYVYELINHGKADRRTECFVVTLPPVEQPPELFRHDGEELFFALSGRIRFVYGGMELILNAGDALYFDASVEHRGLADGGEPAVALAVIVPPPPAAQSGAVRAGSAHSRPSSKQSRSKEEDPVDA